MTRLVLLAALLAAVPLAATAGTPAPRATAPARAPARILSRADVLDAVLSGAVTDSTTGETLIGASVRIDGTSLGAATDLDGRYRIARVPAGPQTLRVTYVGYREARVQVVVPASGALTVDVALVLDAVQGAEVVVTAQAEGQGAAINQQIQSSQIVNVVSAARLQELPDANAAEAIGRLPGVSIQRDAGEAQNVVIRGLSPRYNNVTVNGIQLPATSFDTRATDLSSIAPELLAGVEVYKSLTPDQNADAIGGSVNFRLQGAPNGLRTQASFQNGYNSLSGSLGQYKATGSVSNRFLDQRIGVFLQASSERNDRSSQRITADYADQFVGEAQTADTLLVNEVNLINRAETRDRYGLSFILDYQLPFGRVQFTNFANRLDRNYVSRDNTYTPNQQTATYDIREADLTTDVLSSALLGDFNLGTVASLDVTLNRSTTSLDTPYDSRARFRENSAFRNDLNRRLGPQAIPGFAVGNVDNTFFERLDFATTRGTERDLGAQANLRAPFTVGSWLSGYVKTGGLYRAKTRANDNTQYFTPLFFSGAGGLDELRLLFPDAVRSTGGQVGLASFVDPAQSGQAILGGTFNIAQAPMLDMARLAQDSLFSISRQAAWGDFRDFTVGEDVSAGYIMTELNFGPRVLLLPGVRYEHTRTSYNAFFGRVPQIDTDIDAQQTVLRDTTSIQRFGNWFPQVQLRVRPRDWFDVRLAYTRSQSRPDFQDTSPQLRISDQGSGLITKGTPGLRPAQSTNVDAAVSFYSNRLGLLSVGGFYKRITGVIYNSVTRLTDADALAAANLAPEFQGYELREPRNLESPTQVRGVEVDFQSNLTWLPGLLRGVVVNANASRIFSDSEIQRLRAETTVGPPPFFIPTTVFSTTAEPVRLLDQPDWIANVSLGYDLGRFSGRSSVLYQRGNITEYGSSARTLSLFDTYLRLDAQASYKVVPSTTLFLQLNNLTDRPDRSFASTGRLLSDEEVYGRSFALGLRFRP